MTTDPSDLPAKTELAVEKFVDSKLERFTIHGIQIITVASLLFGAIVFALNQLAFSRVEDNAREVAERKTNELFSDKIQSFNSTTQQLFASLVAAQSKELDRFTTLQIERAKEQIAAAIKDRGEQLQRDNQTRLEREIRGALTQYDAQLRDSLASGENRAAQRAAEIAREQVARSVSSEVVQVLIRQQEFQDEVRRVVTRSLSTERMPGIRSVRQSMFFEAPKGSPRRSEDPDSDVIQVPSARYPGEPSLLLKNDETGLLVIDVNAQTSYETGETLGIGFGIRVIVNGQQCLYANDQATIRGNSPAIAVSCTVYLGSGSINRIEVRREVFGAGFISSPERSFFRMRYTLMTFGAS